MKTTRVYSLDLVENERKSDAVPEWVEHPREHNLSHGSLLLVEVKAIVDYKPVEFITPEVRGIFASIGIIKGVPFKPNAATKEALNKAVETAKGAKDLIRKFEARNPKQFRMLKKTQNFKQKGSGFHDSDFGY